jgi:hypothetical protein
MPTLCKHKTAWDAHDFIRALFDEVYIFDIYQNKELSRSVLTLAVVPNSVKINSDQRITFSFSRFASLFFFSSVFKQGV